MHGGDVTSTPIADAGFGNLGVADGVGRRDVLGADDARHRQLPHFGIGPNLLGSLNDHVSIGQNPGHHGSDGERDFLCATNASGSRTLGRRGGFQRIGWIEPARQDLAEARLKSQQVRHAGAQAVAAVCRRCVGGFRAVIDIDLNRQNVADPVGALINEEGPRARPP